MSEHLRPRKQPATTLAFCEPSWATPYSSEHIRLLDGPRRLGGGIKSPALCGFDLANGWDLQGEVTRERIERGIQAETNPTCADCAREALAMLP